MDICYYFKVFKSLIESTLNIYNFFIAVLVILFFNDKMNHFLYFLSLFNLNSFVVIICLLTLLTFSLRIPIISRWL